MPELPEVETVRRILAPRILNRQISNVRVTYWRMIGSHHHEFIARLIGRTFSAIERIGKFLIFKFDNDLVLISHLRMEGKYLDLAQSEADSRYARVIFEFTDGGKLCYDDSRCFGTMQLATSATYKDAPSLTKIGPEPFGIQSSSVIFDHYHRSARPIKELLLDQTIMTGLGNIYADEVLYLARIHPELPGNLLTKHEADRLLHFSKEVLNKAIESGGSTIRTYHAAKGVDGRFQHQLFAYDRAGQPCSRCHTILTKIKVKGRGSTYCPRCQINRALPLVIAITGQMHAGKSTILSLAKNMGYPTLSSDELVKEVYHQSKNMSKIEQLLHIVFTDSRLNSRQILEVILTNPKAKKRLEKWVHPLVKHMTIDWIKQQTSRYVFIEVPLLFEAKWDYLAQYIIGVTVPFEIQKVRIESDFEHPELALELAQTNQFLAYQDRVDYLIKNDGDLSSFISDATKALETALLQSIKTAESANF